jgi:hypothetical protein
VPDSGTSLAYLLLRFVKSTGYHGAGTATEPGRCTEKKENPMESTPAPQPPRADGTQSRLHDPAVERTAPPRPGRPLNVVVVGGGNGPCMNLLRHLRKRRHRVIDLLPAALVATTAVPITPAPTVPDEGALRLGSGPVGNDGAAAEAVFRRRTGELRSADLIIVCADVHHREAVLGWVLDQSRGVVAYCETGSERDGDTAADLTGFDLTVSCAPGNSAESLVLALEHRVAVTADAQ